MPLEYSPEIISDGITGILCNHDDNVIENFTAAISKVERISRDKCREEAKQKFDIKIIAPKVVDLLYKSSL